MFTEQNSMTESSSEKHEEKSLWFGEQISASENK